jgi:hypothetical protein
VHILDDQHIQRPRPADLTQQSAEQLPAELPGQVEQRPQRPRREQPITPTPRPAGIRHIPRKLLHQRRLTDTRLPGNQHQPALAQPRLGRIPGQRPLQRRAPRARQQAKAARLPAGQQVLRPRRVTIAEPPRGQVAPPRSR